MDYEGYGFMVGYELVKSFAWNTRLLSTDITTNDVHACVHSPTGSLKGACCEWNNWLQTSFCKGDVYRIQTRS